MKLGQEMTLETSTDRRLDRIESKVDQVVVTLAELARIDERVTGGHKRIDRHEVRLDLIENTQRNLEKAVAKTMGKSMVAERASWILFASVVAALSQYF
jgi:tetrahydromethanopterin S-methyltransferase subunit G